jgi:hypothetical protein
MSGSAFFQRARKSWYLVRALAASPGGGIRFATHAGEPGVIYAANNHGLFRSDDAGWNWKALDLTWPEPGLADGVEALACLPE